MPTQFPDALERLLKPYKNAVQGVSGFAASDPLSKMMNESGGGENPDPLSEAFAKTSGGAGAPPGGGGTKAQLYQGFMDAGRPDLARMVRTKAFNTWIGAESGWDPNVVSPRNNNGQANGGLFQLWYGHDFSNPYEGANSFSASPYKQAKMVANNFDLHPDEIRQYAQSIRNRSYGGWGSASVGLVASIAAVASTVLGAVATFL